jgi:hypothetical protein
MFINTDELRQNATKYTETNLGVPRGATQWQDKFHIFEV